MSSRSKQRIAFYTLGCRSNQYQTEQLKDKLTTNNLQLTTYSDQADIYVINTCSVTNDAERRSRQIIRQAMRQNPQAKIIITGCYAKLAADRLIKEFPVAEILFPQPLTNNQTSRPTQQRQTFPQVRANLMIQDGCENYCTYCIVPYARGQLSFKPINQIQSEAGQLVADGAREIVLTGINLGTYPDLSSVLKVLSSIPELLRIRLSSIEPMYLTDDLIEAMVKTPKVCNYLHLPLQSGDNEILQTMGRPYTIEQYQGLIDKVRAKIPDCGLSTDVIIGFPGETDRQFQNTVSYIKQISFSRLHIFSYSPRTGTPAAERHDQVDARIKKQRNKILQKLNNKLIADFSSRYPIEDTAVLWENETEGTTSNFIRVKRRPAFSKVSMFPLD